MTAPADYEPDNYATDGSVPMEVAHLRRENAEMKEKLRRKEALLTGARTLVENMSGLQEVRRDGHLQQEIRELRMILNDGDALRKTARADELVESWLQDPHRSIFGLAADLLDVMGPADQRRP